MSQTSDPNGPKSPYFDRWLANLNRAAEAANQAEQEPEADPPLPPREVAKKERESGEKPLFPPKPEEWPEDDEDFDPREWIPFRQSRPQSKVVDPVILANSRWRFYSLNQIHDLPTIKTLTGELIYNSLHLLYGPSGVGKSFLALDYALRTSVEHDVVYCAPEGFMGYRTRVEAWQRFFGAIPSHFHLSSQHIPLMNPELLREFARTLNKQKIQPRLFVLDTFAWSLSPGDENSARDVQLAIEGCRYLQKTFTASVLLVHHTGKVGDSERGSSALRAAMDVVLQLRRKQRGFVTLTVAKSKDSQENQSRSLAFVEVIIGPNDESSCILLEGDPSDLDAMFDFEIESENDQSAYQDMLEAGHELAISTEPLPLEEDEKDSVFLSEKQSRYHLTNGEFQILSYISQHEKGITAHQIKTKIRSIKNPYNILGKLLQHHLLSQAGRGQAYIITPKGERALEENK